MMLHRACLAVAVLAICASGVTAAATKPSDSPRESPVKKYSQLRNALLSGKNVVVTIHFDKCTAPGGGVSNLHLSGGFRINEFVMPNDEYISFSNVHSALEPDNTPVTEYVRYLMRSDGAVTIGFTTVSREGKVVRESKLTCLDDRAVQFYGAAS
jgi:VirK protein